MSALSESLGSAELELGADLVPFDDDLDKAQKRAAAFVAATQAILDKLHLNVRDDGSLGSTLSKLSAGAATMATEWAAASDAVRASLGKVDSAIAHTAEATVAASEIEKAAIDSVTAAYLEQAVAARAAADAGFGAGAGAGSGLLGVLAARGGRGHGGGGLSAAEAAAAATAFEGVRGKGHVGSRTNPLVVVLAAGSREPLGSYAAAVAEQAASGGGINPGVVPAGGGGSGGVGAVTGASRGTTAGFAGTSATDQRDAAVRDAALAAALSNLDQTLKGTQTRPAGAVILPGRPQPVQGAMDVILPAGVSSKGQGSEKAIPVIVTDNEPKASSATGDAIAAALADLASKEVGPGQRAKGGDAYRAAYEALGYTVASRVAGGPAHLYAPGGQPGTGNYGLTSEAAALAASRTASGGGVGGGGGGIPPLLAGLLWGHAGGGGGGRRLPGYAGAALAGAGGIGAGFGSLGSFAGFGPEHIILTLGGIAGSGVAALGGGALLGAGALGKLAVGAGSDAVVGASTIADTKSLYGAQSALNTAIKAFGPDSEQAVEAANELKKVYAEIGHTAGVEAEMGVANLAIKVNEFWDKQTSGARVQASKILTQLLELDKAYIPLVAHAAEQNFTVINRTIKPLLAWLKGPEGMGIFLELEREFKDEIPTAMAALDQGVQFFAKTVAYTAPMTGKFLSDLDRFFTKWNSPGEFAVWEGEMQKLIADFHTWGAFVRELGGALVDLFDKDAHTGEGIIKLLTEMLHKVREYENSAKGSEAIRTIFSVHKTEVEELLKVLIPLISSFSHIYTTVAPPLVKAVTEIARGFDWLLETIEKGGKLGEWAIGLTLIAAKLKLLTPLLTALKTELLGTAAAESEVAAGALADAGAGAVYARAVTAEEAAVAMEGAGILGTAGGTAGLLSKGTLLRGGLAGTAGVLGGSLLAGAVGAKGTLGTAISGAGGGAGVGFVAGGAITGSILGTEITPVIGTAIGAVLGAATPLAIKFLEETFATHAPNYGKKLAEGILGPQSALGASKLYQPGIEGALNAAHRASKPTGLSGGLAAGITTAVAGVPGIGPTLSLAAGALLSGSGPNRAAQAKDEKTAGERVAKAFVAGFQEVRFPTKSVLLAQMQETLDKTPVGAAREAAAKAMIAYAQELEAKGALPKGAVTEVIHSLEGQFPHLAGYLKQQGKSMASQFASALELKEAKLALGQSLDKIGQLFGTSNENTLSNAEHTMTQLAFVIAHSKGPLKAAAEEAFGELSHVVSANFEAAKQAVAQQTAGINQQLEAEFAAIGMPTKIGVGKKGELVLSHPNPLSGTPFGKAQGGLIQIGRPGEAGHDSVGLNVGGLPIAVAPGEQVAVFNRHQLPVVNAALAPVGGLAGLFDQVSTPNYMASGGIVAPHVGGSGAIPALVRDAMSRVAGAANHKLGSVGASAAGAGPAGGGPPASSNEALGRRMMLAEGFPASEWGYLQKLWTKESGWRTTAQNPTSPAYGIPQSDPGDKMASAGADWRTNPATQIKWGLGYIRSTYQTIAKAWATELAQNAYGLGGLLHFATGGLLGFAKGGQPQVKAQYPQRKSAGKLPKGVHFNPFGPIPPVKTSWGGQADAARLSKIMAPGGPLAAWAELYGLEESADELALSHAPHGGAFVVQPNAIEKAAGITLPYEDPTNVSMRAGQLDILNQREHGVLNYLTEGWNLSHHVLAAAEAGIRERNKAIADLKARIRDNLKKIRELRAAIHRQEEALKKLPTGKHATAASRAQAAKLHREIADEHGQIKALENENAGLGGSPSEVGTGGNIGALIGERTELASTKTSAEGYVQEIGGASGRGGKRGEAQLTIAKLAQQLIELGETPTRLAEAKLEAGGGGESALELAEREKAQGEEKLKLKTEELRISTQALGVFSAAGDIGTGGKTAFAAAAAMGGLFVPMSYAGSFDSGGVVPGPRGAPALALVHGDEEVLTPEQRQRQPGIVNNWKIETLTPGDPRMLRAVGDAATRGQRLQGNRVAKRLVPGI